MVVTGAGLAHWVAGRIESGVVRNTALATALYVESFLSPELQELATSDRLSERAQASLAALFKDTPLGDRVQSYKIWGPGGRIITARDEAKIGAVFPETDSLAAAWKGEVRAEFEDLVDDEDAGESLLGMPLLEIYSPVRAHRSDRIIAVAEFYEAAPHLREELAAARRSTWAAVLAAVAGAGAILFGIVLRGSRTIRRQFADLLSLSSRNTSLRLRIQGAAARSSTLHEQIVRRIGADLHDGPAQLLAFAALRLETLRGSLTDGREAVEFDAVDQAVKEAVQEIRTLSRGLTLPVMEDRSIGDVVRAAIEAHMGRTGSEVSLEAHVDPSVELSDAVRICAYRFTQEALTNAWRHAGPEAGAAVTLDVRPGLLALAVTDRGPGLPPAVIAQTGPARSRIGLSAMRDRVESLGGIFSLGNRAGGGAEVRMELEL